LVIPDNVLLRIAMDFENTPFIHGLELSERYYFDAVQPLLRKAFPDLRHSAALIGYGSDVIGLDTPMSRDHMWGPRLILFLPETNFDSTLAAVDAILRQGLPHSFLGYPTSLGPSSEPGTWILTPTENGPVDHMLQITTLVRYFDRELGKGCWQAPTPADWLVFSEHRLLTLTAGKVFQDDLGLEEIRRTLAYYPRDVWIFLLASEWSKVGQEEPFVGRTGDSGDDLGSRILAGRLAHTCMRLAFLMQRRYAPYSKWFGTAFARWKIEPALLPILTQALAAVTWQERQQWLCEAYQLLVQRHNQLNLTSPVQPKCSGFHGRPFQVIHAGEITQKLQAVIQDPLLKNIRPYGSVNQFSTSTDLLEEVGALAKLKALYP
jgi:hypothetical protein